MPKSIFFFFVIVNYVLCALGQNNKNEVDLWKEKFDINNGHALKPKTNFENTEFLIEIYPGSEKFLFADIGLIVKRQLDKENYIVRASKIALEKCKSQIKYILAVNNNWKLSPSLLRNSISRDGMQTRIFHVVVSSLSAFDSLVIHYSDQVSIEMQYESLHIIRVRCSDNFILSFLINAETVTYVEQANRPIHNETPISGFDNSVNTLNTVHSVYPFLNGGGLVVSVKEDNYNDQDIDLAGRNIATSISSNTISQHATDMATLIGGSGNSFFSGTGAAVSVGLSSASSANLFPDLDAYKQYQISVQNHSYGVGIENFYGADAAAYDNSIISYPILNHIFSSGNSGDQTPNDGSYAGIPGVSNLTGSFKMAKNIITVGSIDVLGVVATLSSKGPAYDGRVKPELVAYGEAGSSEAAAITSGIALLLQNAYAQAHNGLLPENALVKAILINSAKDVDVPGIDFSSGYGSVDAFRAVQNMLAQKYLIGDLIANQEKTFNLYVPDSARNLKITLVWNDPAAKANAFKALVNDLDLTLINNTSGEISQPWVLNSTPSLDSLHLPAHRGRDSLNVVEQITLNAPTPGDYSIRINSSSISGSDQRFYISYQWDTLNHFHWTYPTSQDFMGRQGSNMFRWEGSFNVNAKGKLEISLDNGNNWKLIDSSVNLGQYYYPWTPTDTFSIALARMSFYGQTFVSDSFSFSSPINLQVGFDCTDSLMLYWKQTLGADHYRIYSIINHLLTPVRNTKDTSIILNKETGYPYYSVAPVLVNDMEGVKSYTLFIPDQGSSCYISNFTAFLQNNQSISLSLDLSSLYQVTHIYFEKKISNSWILVQDFSVNIVSSFTATDFSPNIGGNTYRARIRITNGQDILSNEKIVYYIGNQYIVVVPNPVLKDHSFNVLSKNTYMYSLSIADVSGRIVYKKTTPGTMENISTANFQSGVYIITLRKNNGETYSRKFIVE